MPATRPHPLRRVLDDAARGRFPHVDGEVEVLPPDDAGTHAVVELTGHSYVLTDRSLDELVAAGAHGYGGCTHPDVLRLVAGPGGWIGSLDAVLVASGIGRPVLPERDDLDEHPRVVRARAHRRDVRVYGDDHGLVTLGHGLVGRLELSVELLEGAPRSSGRGRELVVAGLHAAPEGALVWAQVSPGNAASLRAFLACGFVPVGSEVLVQPA